MCPFCTGRPWAWCWNWCYRRSPARWGAAVVFTYGTLGLLVWSSRESATDRPTSPSDPLGSVCRSNMQVNLLPPMSDDFNTMMKDLFTYLTQPHPKACRKVLKFGGMAMRNIITGDPAFSDGQKYVCADPEFSLFSTSQCLVYSFGISEDWSFDWDMEGWDCRVYSFDPSINIASGGQNGTIMFLRYGIGEYDHTNDRGWQIRTLDTFYRRLRHSNRTIHYLKLDVEGAEWQTLQQQLAKDTGSVLTQRVEQLGMELHFSRHPPRRQHSLFYMEVYRMFLKLQQAGFYPFSYEPNFSEKATVEIPGLPYNVTSAMEVGWIRSRCVNVAVDGG